MAGKAKRNMWKWRAGLLVAASLFMAVPALADEISDMSSISEYNEETELFDETVVLEEAEEEETDSCQSDEADALTIEGLIEENAGLEDAAAAANQPVKTITMTVFDYDNSKEGIQSILNDDDADYRFPTFQFNVDGVVHNYFLDEVDLTNSLWKEYSSSDGFSNAFIYLDFDDESEEEEENIINYAAYILKFKPSGDGYIASVRYRVSDNWANLGWGVNCTETVVAESSEFKLLGMADLPDLPIEPIDLSEGRGRLYTGILYSFHSDLNQEQGYWFSFPGKRGSDNYVNILKNESGKLNNIGFIYIGELVEFPTHTSKGDYYIYFDTTDNEKNYCDFEVSITPALQDIKLYLPNNYSSYGHIWDVLRDSLVIAKIGGVWYEGKWVERNTYNGYVDGYFAFPYYGVNYTLWGTGEDGDAEVGTNIKPDKLDSISLFYADIDSMHYFWEYFSLDEMIGSPSVSYVPYSKWNGEDDSSHVHSWDTGKITTQPTCTASGVRTYTCLTDSSHAYTESVPALGHAYGAWTVTKEATEEEEGTESRTCVRCGEEETRTLAKIPSNITISKKPAQSKPTAAAKGKVTFSWKKFKQTKKTKAVWKKVKKIEVQYSTDPSFKTDVTSKLVGKKKTKLVVKKLQKNTTYYVRIRYTDGAGGYSDWSATKKIKTKKK